MKKKAHGATGVLLTVVLLIFLTPLAGVFALSFFSTGRFSLEEYRAFFADRDLLRSFGNSAKLTLGTLAMQLPLSLLGGLTLSQMRGKARGLLLGALLVMLLLPFQSYMMPLFLLSKAVRLYDHPLAPTLLYAFAPLGPLLMFVFIRAIPGEQFEAAALETSSLLRTARYVVLPQLAPAVMILLLLTFVEAWNMVEPALILFRDDWHRPASVTLNNRDAGTWAASALYALPVLALYLAACLPLRNKGQEH